MTLAEVTRSSGLSKNKAFRILYTSKNTSSSSVTLKGPTALAFAFCTSANNEPRSS